MKNVGNTFQQSKKNIITIMFLVHYKNMKTQHFSISPTINKLINIEVERTRYHVYEHNAVALNKLQRAYLELLDEWGINFPFSARDLCQKSGYPLSSFCSNFCGGMKGFLSQCERVVIDRFTEAVRGRDFRKGLYNGFQSFLQPIRFSDYNTNRQQGIDMALRTEFCHKVFGAEYWRMTLSPLFSAIDAFLRENEPRWQRVSVKEQKYAYDLFAEEFHWVVGLIIEDNKRHNESATFIPLDEYVNLYCQFVQTTVLMLFSNINLRDTLFEALIKRRES